MRYFNKNCYSGTPWHGDWKYALQEYGKGMDETDDARKYYLRRALQILENVPCSTYVEGVSHSDVTERSDLVSEISNNL